MKRSAIQDDMWSRYDSDPSDENRNALVERYLPVVEYHAERIASTLPESVSVEDLMSAGVFGLIDAIAAFDVKRGTKFETFSALRVRGAILDELRSMDWVPRLVRQCGSRLVKAANQFIVAHGRAPTEAELARHMGLSIAELSELRRGAAIIKTASLSRKRYETDTKEVYESDLIEDTRGENPRHRMISRDRLREFTKGLNKTERLLLLGYYYFDQTMKEIGECLYISESRVSQMHTDIIRRIRERFQVAGDAA